MTHRIRAARPDDLDALYDLAKLTGGGFTNLPAERETLAKKLESSSAGFARDGDEQSGDLYIFMLEEYATGRIRGTCQVFGEVGTTQPFYSYRITTLTQHSKELERTFRNQLLNLVTDLEGSSEVGGLFLHPHERAGGLGLLLARSRYLFIKQHRARFGDRTLAELRGVMDEAGHSPFWDALAGRFFGMSFPEADEFNAVHGTQFIADLMPSTPIYINMLPESARAVIGQPHPSGRAALRMLEKEGFAWDGYVDIFDGGPTVIAKTDRIKSVRDANEIAFAGTGEEEGDVEMLVATGKLEDFRCCYAHAHKDADGGLRLDPQAAKMLEVKEGDMLLAVNRR
ncbi:arginine N-succinyltransferase [Sphingomicrobium lutaoense]|uniref:Arginine N-succinyltransferase n=1 Tax=Sphingomicrobium lutaoense TaxID=515949 RepID=A0A839YXS2_9SPHN|nr:arginine N-succinyltransferase [Sphingomicrobium lutaoense]MBB3763280.1 arginine N-succinyltransferase [Sphingomicrobium lutaoense]